MTDSLPIPKKAPVTFCERPKLSKTKSFKPNKIEKMSPPRLDLGLCKPANEQDEDEDFSRAEDDDSDEDYDGVPCTEEIPLVEVIPVETSDRMEMTMEQNSNSVEHENLNDLPQTQTVDDYQLELRTQYQNLSHFRKRKVS